MLLGMEAAKGKFRVFYSLIVFNYLFFLGLLNSERPLKIRIKAI